MPFRNPVGTLTIPNGATTGARIVIGNDVPPELVAWGTPLNVTIDTVILYYFNTTDYVFEGVGHFVGIPAMIKGVYNSVDGVYVVERTLDFGGQFDGRIEHRWGSYALNTYNMKLYSQQALFSVGTVTPPIGDASAIGPLQIFASEASSTGVFVPGVNTASGSFAIPTNAPNVAFSKIYDLSTIDIDLRFGGFVTVGSTGIDIGVRVDNNAGTVFDEKIGVAFWNTASQHQSFSVRGKLVAGSSMVHGSYTISMIWRRNGGTGTINADLNDQWSLTCRESNP